MMKRILATSASSVIALTGSTLASQHQPTPSR